MKAQELCMALVQADSPDEVVSILQKAGYWDDHAVWRDLGDNENNYSVVGAQQSDPIAALVEKLVNSVDARLMNECMVAGIKPDSKEAPRSVREAVAQLIEHSDPSKETNGRIENWTQTQRSEQAKRITLAATGSKSAPCLSISDDGEGQTPENVPHTFMSLAKANKLRIPFVQGKFNMGGTGALRFCGGFHHLQLIITKRNPALATSAGEDDWSFTVVRRMEPTAGERSSVYRYLAPLTVPGLEKGQVLRFAATSLPLRPQGNNPYVLPQTYGSFVKLYDYGYKGRSHILMKDGLLRQVDARLPSPALPFTMHECRDYAGHSGSFSDPATGLLVRLWDDKDKKEKDRNLDSAFPKYDQLSVRGQNFTVSLFGFKQGRAGTYLNKSEGVLFVVNGQSHGTLTSRFFTRTKVGLDYIADSLLVCLDCSKLDRASLEELFMNTRESLAESEFRYAVEEHLQDFLKKHSLLREFNNRRREEKIKEKVQDDENLANTLKDVLTSSPSLAAIFLTGEKLKSGFNVKQTSTTDEFVGKLFPTYFRFRNRAQGEELSRTAEECRAVRIGFETDVEDNYFGRPKDPGQYTAEYLTAGVWAELPSHSMQLVKGHATLSIDLPEGAKAGEVLNVRVIVSDDVHVDSFENHAKLKIVPFKEHEPNPNPNPNPKPPSNKSGEQETGPAGIQLPTARWVKKEEWAEYGFDERSALRIIPAGEEGKKRSYDFFINKANVHLLNELKAAVGSEEVTYEQFKVGMLLLGMSVIHNLGPNADGDLINQKASEFASSAALVLLPMIRHLGGLELLAKPKLKEAA
ncbi:MAG TPA: hypothetical protein VFL96_04475 [Acidobacteriaceae bacterium]|nr:hypothetical protein [Acidobacteriaceae bacterium]